MYYNSNQKKEYLKVVINSGADKLKQTEKLFRLMAAEEEKRRIDLCEFTARAVIGFLYKNKDIKAYETLRRLGYAFNAYKRWALVNNYIASPSGKMLDDFNDAILSVMKNDKDLHLYTSPQRLIDDLDKYYPANNDDYVDPKDFIRAYLVLIYQGFPKEEIVNLLYRDVICNERYLAIYNSSRIYVIYKEFRPIIEKIYRIRDNIKTGFIYEKPMNTSGPSSKFLLNVGRVTEEESLKRIRNWRNLIAVHSNKRFPLNDKEVYFMGQVYRFKTLTHFKLTRLARACEDQAMLEEAKDLDGKAQSSIFLRLKLYSDLWDYFK